MATVTAGRLEMGKALPAVVCVAPADAGTGDAASSRSGRPRPDVPAPHASTGQGSSSGGRPRYRVLGLVRARDLDLRPLNEGHRTTMRSGASLSMGIGNRRVARLRTQVLYRRSIRIVECRVRAKRKLGKVAEIFRGTTRRERDEAGRFTNARRDAAGVDDGSTFAR